MTTATPSPALPHALRAWPSSGFASALKAEIEALPIASLPLQAVVAAGSYVDERGMTVRVLGSQDDGSAILARVGVFFTEIVASCGCGGEPMEQDAYCELQVRIDKATAAAGFVVIPD